MSATTTTTVESGCPLDCPDACSLSVTVKDGRVITIDGSHSNAVTRGYICAKVRGYAGHLYGPERLLYPAVRRGLKGEGRFERATWAEALSLITDRLRATSPASAGAPPPPPPPPP